jgi:uncharacterized protein YndB with AHSA1/START domain
MGDTVSVTREIRAPAERVWAMVTDLPRMGEWSPESLGGLWVQGATGPAPGAKFKGENEIGKKAWSTDATVIDAEPGRRFSFRVSVGPIQVAEWAYDFEDTPTGCRVTETWTDHRNGVIRRLGKFTSGVADRAEHNRRGMEETLLRLEAAAVNAIG